MPQKRNPAASVLIRSAALRAPQLGATLHLASALAVDERPDGAWHAEWPTLRELLRLALGATAHAAALVAGPARRHRRRRRNLALDAAGSSWPSGSRSCSAPRSARERVSRLASDAAAAATSRRRSPAARGRALAAERGATPEAFVADLLDPRTTPVSPERSSTTPSPWAVRADVDPGSGRTTCVRGARRTPRTDATRPEPRSRPGGERVTLPAIAVSSPVGPSTGSGTARRPGADAPTLVLGPSLGTSTMLWERVIPALAEHYRVVAWDLPGPRRRAGGDGAVHDRPTSPTPSPAAVDGPFLYAGVSLGGCVGPRAAAAPRRPRRRRRDRVLGGGDRRTRGLARPRRAGAGAEHVEPRHRLRAALVRAGHRSRATPTSPGACCTCCRTPTTRATRCAARRSPPTTCATGSARSPRRCSRSGAITTASRPRHPLARSPTACSTAGRRGIADAAHLPPADDPAATAAALLEFFDAVAGERAA